MEWLHLPLKSYVVYLRASNAKIAFEILTGGEIASSVECAMGDKPPLFLGEPVRREKGRCGQVNDPLSRGRRGVAAAAAVIAETSCCRLREAKGKGGRERVGARARARTEGRVSAGGELQQREAAMHSRERNVWRGRDRANRSTRMHAAQVQVRRCRSRANADALISCPSPFLPFFPPLASRARGDGAAQHPRRV